MFTDIVLQVLKLLENIHMFCTAVFYCAVLKSVHSICISGYMRFYLRMNQSGLQCTTCQRTTVVFTNAYISSLCYE